MFDMVSRRGFVSLSAVAAAGLGLAGCSGSKTSEPAGSDAGSAKASSKKAVELQVFAANSLEKALPEVQELYTDQTGTTFADTQFKASGDLVEQMRAGATVDVLITASKGTMDDAEAAELVDADTREDMFVNDLAIIRAEGSDTKIEAIANVANLDGKIAIGDAKTVPAGKYANQALASVGLYTGTEATTASMHPSLPTRWPWPTRSAPLRLTSLRATALPVLSTALTSTATTVSRRPSCAPRTRTSPSCIRAPLPMAPNMPTRPRRLSTSACPARRLRRYGLSTALSFPRSAAWRDNSIVLCFTPSLYSLGAFRA